MSGTENNSEDKNENLLKNTAITFTLEGLSRDLDKYIQKKITFNNRSLKYVSEMVQAISSSSTPALKKQIFNKNSELNKMLANLTEEMSTINSLLNYVVQRIFKKEEFLRSDVSDDGLKPKKKSSNGDR